LRVDEDSGVVIKFDIGTIETFHLFPRPDNDRPNHIPLFDLGIGQGVFDGNDNDISQGRILATCPAEDLDAS
jgi:hypothetical protein